VSRESRLKLIEEIEAIRGSRLLVAVWGDRQNLGTIIAPDAPAVFFEHLEKMGKVHKLDVLLYTVGGHTLAAWALANLVREYCDQLGVLVPHRALSAGTLFTLSADEIIMSRARRIVIILRCMIRWFSGSSPLTELSNIGAIIGHSVTKFATFLPFRNRQKRKRKQSFLKTWVPSASLMMERQIIARIAVSDMRVPVQSFGVKMIAPLLAVPFC
jgi:hypothetical protein